MRGWLVLAIVSMAVGCQTTKRPQARETHAEMAGSGFVSLPRLADDLDLEYHGEDAGFIELSRTPDNVMFVSDSSRVLVNGTQVSLVQACMRRGDDFVLTADDARLVRLKLTELRVNRPAAPPLSIPPPLVIRSPKSNPGMAAWRPDPGVKVRNWRFIVVHHTAGPTGSAAYIHRLHRQRGWDGLGYHFVIGNGSMTGDGEIELGYRWKAQLKGAHARARPNDDNRWNLNSIGICLVGDFTDKGPSRKQMDALVRLVRALCAEYHIPPANVVPHRFVRNTECPGKDFPWNEFTKRIR